MTKVVNIKTTKAYTHYIGRAYSGIPASKWANPFKIGRDGTRAQVLALYREYILARPDLLEALPELQGAILGCWCKPLPCHGDILIELLSKKSC